MKTDYMLQVKNYVAITSEIFGAIAGILGIAFHLTQFYLIFHHGI